MRRYETIIIIDPDLSAEKREPVVERVKDVIAQQGGYLAFIDDWGTRKLAYEIKKKARGYYLRFDFCGTGAVVDEIERFFRIDDRVLKYMTVLLDEKADIEKIKEEVAAAESKAEKAKESAEPAAAQAPEEQTEPSETETAKEQAEPSETETAEEKAEPSEIETPEKQARLPETQLPEPEVNEADTTPTETEEEIK